MPKYLFQVSFTAEGTRGVLAEGGTKRKQAVAQLMKSLGGKLETMYFAFGSSDSFRIAELPDHASAAAGTMLVGASGAGRVTTTVLMTPAEIDEACARQGKYRPPGS